MRISMNRHVMERFYMLTLVPIRMKMYNSINKSKDLYIHVLSSSSFLILYSQYFCAMNTRSKVKDKPARPSLAGLAIMPEGS